MIPVAAKPGVQKTTSYKVVLPFYFYAALSFLAACIMLVFSTDAFQQHYFSPQVLSITHIMALGWGTMVIFGASHQLVPVLIEGKLYSNFLAFCSFIFLAIGIPLLACGFYTFNLGLIMQSGAILINLGILSFLLNIGISIYQSKTESPSSIFVLSSAIWLQLTALIGLLLVFNFTTSLLSKNSLAYLPLHAHIGIVGWFLLLVTGVGSRLIPLFLISKYSNTKLLWWIFACINLGLISFIFNELTFKYPINFSFFVIPVAAGVIMFLVFCYKAYKERVRKKVDQQMKLSLVSVLLMLIPLACLLIAIQLFLSHSQNYNILLLYGFCIFFGWITAIIFGMTFKTLPFIVWNKVYHGRAKTMKTPNPKDLFSEKLYIVMTLCYLSGFITFGLGIAIKNNVVLISGGLLLLLAAVSYISNSVITIWHKPSVS
jgi:hypothetical protein